jgi:hypothetical protein
MVDTNIMGNKKLLTDRFSEVGLKDIETRLKTLVNLFNSNDKWKQDLQMLGFGLLNIDDREECFGRIKELSEILGIPFKLNKIENQDGQVIDYKIELGMRYTEDKKDEDELDESYLEELDEDSEVEE